MKLIDMFTKGFGYPHDRIGNRKKRERKLSSLGATLCTVLLILFVWIGVLLFRFESERYKQQEIEKVQQLLDAVQASLKSRVYSNIYKVSAVKALVAMNPDLTQDDFARAMEVQFRGEDDLRNIGLSRGMVIQFMYPIEGNEAAVGLDYTTLPEQFEAVDLARRTNKIVLAGPLELVQGGEGLIARIPIYSTDSASDQETFWGIASVVMNSESIFAGAGIQENHDALRIAIRGRDAQGAKGDIFFGDPLIFESTPLTKMIDLPYGGWQIGAIPSAGWCSCTVFSTPLMWIYMLAASTILAFTMLILFLLDKRDKVEKERIELTRSLEVFLMQTTDFIYYKDINSRFIFCSQTLADITNHKHWKEMVGKHDFDVFPHETAEIYNKEEEPVFKEGKPILNKINPYYAANGKKGYVMTNKWPIFDENNHVSGIFGISRDITEHKEAVDELEKERNLFAEGPVFTIEWDPEPYGNWHIRYASSNVEHILGYSPGEMLRSEFSYNRLIHPDDLEAILNDLKLNISNHIDSFEQSYRLQTKTGQYLWIYDFTVLVRDEENILTGIRSYMYDQTTQKKAEEALRIAEATLEKVAYDLTENIPIGTYTMVQPAHGGMANFAFMSSRFLELTGLTREEAVTDPMKAFACVHPDDYEAWVAHNARVFKEKTPFFGETRVVVNEAVRWVAAESIPRTLPDGSTVWEGVLADITGRKRAEEALSESLRRFNELVTHVSVGVYIFWIRADGRKEFEYVSDGWCKMNQIRREDVLADPVVAFNVIHPEDQMNFMSLNQEVVREKKRFLWEGRIVIGGDVIFTLIESTPVFFDNGDSRWFGIQQNITKRKKAEAILHKTNIALEKEVVERKIVEEKLKVKTDMLEKLSMQDGLTDIPNRRYFDERANLEWKRAMRSGLPFSLVMMDIDHFKNYNDRYGHGAGDDCLRQVAIALKKTCARPLDLVARYGGEEFVALLPETDAEGAFCVAEKMRAAVEDLSIPHDSSGAASVVTLSVGVATHGSGDVKTDLRHLQQCADQALYCAKNQGRNQVQGES